MDYIFKPGQDINFKATYFLHIFYYFNIFWIYFQAFKVNQNQEQYGYFLIFNFILFSVKYKNTKNSKYQNFLNMSKILKTKSYFRYM